MLSMIFLAYNDGKSLEENLPAWINVLEKTNGAEYEIIIADDCSTDHTDSVVRKFTQHNNRIRVVKSDCNEGVGANFRKAISHSRGNFIAYTDGDGQYWANDLPVLWAEIHKYDMVTGRRVKRADQLKRIIASHIYNCVVMLIYPIHIKDINSGLKIFRKSYIESCFPQLSDGPFFDAEYLIKGLRSRKKIKEIPIHHYPRKYGRQAGISRKSVQFLFKELCQKNMEVFTRTNHFSKFLFKLLSIPAKA